jgi:gliding motility-associated-like protein
MNLSVKLLGTALAFSALTILSSTTHAQEVTNVNCVNLGFDENTFNLWTGYTGSYTTIGTATEVQGIVGGRHEIMTGPGTDANTGGNITVVAPNNVYSTRLGNESVGAQGDRLEYSMTVSAQNALFIYQYAVVLEDPSHSTNAQPTFDIEVLDQAGNVIDPICGVYHVTAGGSIPGFVSLGTVRYKDWAGVGLDLTPYIGQTVTVSFQVRDCNLGGHFGYAYIDAQCGPLEISTQFCAGSNTITFTAPGGFEYLWSNGDTNQVLSIPSTDTVNVWTCTLTSVTGCQVTLTAVTDPTIFYPSFDFQSCTVATFTDQSTINYGQITDWEWDFGDPPSGPLNTSTDQNPTHIYPVSGFYDITLIMMNSQGCSDTSVWTLYVHVEPVVDFVWEDDCFEGDAVASFTNLTTVGPLDTVVYDWAFDPVVPTNSATPSVSTATDQVVTFSLDEDLTNQYEVTLIATLPNGCSTTLMQVVDIYPLPDLPDPLPNVFTPDGNTKNDRYYIQNVEFMTTSKIQIFNRWGIEVYQDDRYNGDWDGKFNGDQLSDGIYYYILETTDCVGVPTTITNGVIHIYGTR